MLKADSGTYGMGVLCFEDPQELISLNRKDRNKLYKGKGAQIINRFILQEGVPTQYTIDKMTAELCMYQFGSHPIGSFYRLHPDKNPRQNLNSQGMLFRKNCAGVGDSLIGEHDDLCGSIYTENSLYTLLSRVAALAAASMASELASVNP